MNWWYGYGGPGIAVFGGIMMILWWALIIIAIVAVIRWIRWNTPGGRGHHNGWRSSSALEILQERFAKGEIDEKEYERRKKVLEE